MDARVDDFLNEINEIAPIKEKKSDCMWQECYDDGSGFAYYWNTVTDEVTWERPKDYREGKESRGGKKFKKGIKDLYIPPRTLSIESVSRATIGNDAIKIYKVGDDTRKIKSSHQITSERIKTVPSHSKNIPERRRKASSESDDEKIVLISSYGGDTESEEDEDLTQEKILETQTQASRPSAPPPTKSKVDTDDDDIDEDLLSKIQKRAKELKALGGQLPPGVEKIVEKPETIIPKPNDSKTKPKKDISGFSLVAGYGDSDEEQDTPESKILFPIPSSIAQENKVSHSTLFPISKPVDIRDFSGPPVQPSNPPITPPAAFDTKMFQRKRRIGIDLINTNTKRPTQTEEKKPEESERKGLGFGGNNHPSTSTYPGFKSGGIMFVKSDVLQPSSVPKEGEVESNATIKNDKEEEKSAINKNDVIHTYTSLKEKLSFLSEGRPVVSPVRAMIIQIETLYTAMQDGGLKLTYLDKWLTETCADLIKLEKEATPEGWLLHWDRSHKRYYYQNQHTGECQWDYPQPDVVRCDEAMDISTTPPPCPPYADEELSPPLPPKIRSPSPPPPPIISVAEEEESLKSSAGSDLGTVPLPPPPPSTRNGDQPLPPGVDQREENYSKTKDGDTADKSLSSALDSFYSDIAALENSNSPKPNTSTVNEELTAPPPPPPPMTSDEGLTEPPKKKKKKMKLAEGLSMKKKGVSKLVEKWKSVQMTLSD